MTNSNRILSLIHTHRAQLEALEALPRTPGRDRAVQSIQDEVHALIQEVQGCIDARNVINKAKEMK
jgi:hypothetical protein